MNSYEGLKLAPGMRSRLKPDNNSHTQQHNSLVHSLRTSNKPWRMEFVKPAQAGLVCVAAV
ncbi:hypothetical protein [Coleofasciculus chthonoplastes]|uniref:hypothetical protein n=1 Tax=Coleofasciculus TaxID=669368 RepID=UPI0033008D46